MRSPGLQTLNPPLAGQGHGLLPFLMEDIKMHEGWSLLDHWEWGHSPGWSRCSPDFATWAALLSFCHIIPPPEVSFTLFHKSTLFLLKYIYFRAKVSISIPYPSSPQAVVPADDPEQAPHPRAGLDHSCEPHETIPGPQRYCCHTLRSTSSVGSQ